MRHFDDEIITMAILAALFVGTVWFVFCFLQWD